MSAEGRARLGRHSSVEERVCLAGGLPGKEGASCKCDTRRLVVMGLRSQTETGSRNDSELSPLSLLFLPFVVGTGSFVFVCLFLIRNDVNI